MSKTYKFDKKDYIEDEYQIEKKKKEAKKLKKMKRKQKAKGMEDEHN